MTIEQTKQRAELIESLERKLSDAEQIKASSIAIRTFQVEQILTALKQKEWVRVEDIEDLPHEPILAYNRFGLYLTGYLEAHDVGHDVGYICVNGFKEIHNVTHIQYLTPPTES